MGGVPLVAVGRRLGLAAREAEQVDLAIVIAGGQEPLIVRLAASVDVSAVSTLGPDASGGEGQHTGLGGPANLLGHRGAGQLLA